MHERGRRWWQLIWLASGLAVAGCASAYSLQVAHLDADPVPEQVLAGDFDRQFIATDDPVIRQHDRAPHWWRVTTTEPIGYAGAPQLVLQTSQLSEVEIWTPGQALPVRRALTGANADPGGSTRALVAPLPGGLAATQSVYLRVHAPGSAPMSVSIEPLAQVRRADLAHVAWRAMALSGLLVLAVLALGFWIGIGERSHGYLLLALLAQAGFFASSGGEIRLLPWLAELAGTDARLTRLFGMMAMIAYAAFLARFLELRARQPRLLTLLHGCIAATGLLALVNLFTAAGWVAAVANVLMLAAATLILVASAIGCLRHQRVAWFVLLPWLPLLALLGLAVGELLGLWRNPGWVGHAVPAGFVLSGLVFTVGLTDTMQQMRRDRDHASKLATFDALTGAMSRAAIEQGLKVAVAEAHRSGRSLSVVFFDIDKFKRINDDYGHRVGDSCLRIIGLRTRNRLRTYDLFGRFGGDEILVVLPDTRLGEALGVAENLRSAVNCRPLSVDGQMLGASLSLGVAELAAGETAEHLLERADEALYASKAAGRDRVTGHRSRVTASRARLST